MSLPRLEDYPRMALGNFPTPLQPLPRLSDRMGRRIFIKRDDLPGPVMGGNKVRKLEYLMAEALSLGARKVVTFGGLQSNHARLTAAAAVQCGMEPHLFYFERRPRQLTGNLVINDLLGAKMHFIPFGGGGNASMTLEKTIWLVRLVARIVTGPHYFIPVGGHSWLGCLGYVRAALEIDTQAREMGLENAWVVLAAGTGGTLAGLMAGFALLHSPLKLLALDVGKLWLAFPESIAQLAGQICAQLGEPRIFLAQDVPLIEGTYAGKRYGAPSAAGMAAVKLLARTEGILLDPIYTAKACAGMLDLIEGQRLGRREPVIFLHTGGLPGLFAFPSGFSR